MWAHAHGLFADSLIRHQRAVAPVARTIGERREVDRCPRPPLMGAGSSRGPHGGGLKTEKGIT
jgi:hypothetical protein